jgi:hypothetical protein
MKKVMLLSGPPSAGKDTAAKYLYHKDNLYPSNIIFERFSAPLKTAFAAITGKSYNHFYEVDYYEANKEKIIPWLGVSFRQWQIDFSEKFMKPNYGKDIFGKLFVERIMAYNADPTDRAKCIVVPDSGFDIEIQYMEQHYPIDDIILCRVHRDGCDFTNDSRSYVYSDKIFSIDLNNNTNQQEFEAKVSTIYAWFIEGNSSLVKRSMESY